MRSQAKDSSLVETRLVDAYALRAARLVSTRVASADCFSLSAVRHDRTIERYDGTIGQYDWLM